MSSTENSQTAADVIADKLLAEGERTTTFFATLPPDIWSRQLYADGARWTVAHTLEHLTLAEERLRGIIADVADGGAGAPSSFDIDNWNLTQTGASGLSEPAALLAAFRTTRAATAAFARGLSAEQLPRRGRHPAMGDSAVADMLKMVYLHNTLHIKDIKRLLAA